MPDTRPDTPFIDGECAACVSFRKRKTTDWDARKADLLQLLDRHNGECIVASSGGKDSHWQVLKLLELGAHVTAVTATTCHLTAVGRANIDNLARHAKTIEITPDRRVRAILNRVGLELVGDISWPEHVSIFTTPFRAACDLGIPLLFYGENPQEAYGGPPGSDAARQMTRRWVSEFGGFLGLRPLDLVGTNGITERDMRDYLPPTDDELRAAGVEAHFLGQYLEWDSRRNRNAAVDAGMKCVTPSIANWWAGENMDNAQTGIHDYFMYRKYGYGRGCAQISVDVRTGMVSRSGAEKWVELYDGTFPDVYMEVPIAEVLDRIGMTRAAFDNCVKAFSCSPRA
jgi:hypothetical protein